MQKEDTFLDDMSTNGINIIGIDEASKSRGVGRYSKALLSMVESMPSSKRNVVINPFFPVDGSRIASSKFSGNTVSIAVVHDVIPLKYKDHFPLGMLGKMRLILNKIKLKECKAIITDSLASAHDIQSVLGIPSSRIRVIYPFSPITSDQVNGSRPKSLPMQVAKNGFALYVGDVNWHKNIVNIAESCILANLPLVVVGKSFELLGGAIGDHTELDELRKFQKIYHNNPERIFALGYVSDAELAWLYENTLSNILISHDEGFGYSYIEAAHFGTPSVLSDIPIFREISSSKGAFFVDQKSPELISKTLVHLKNSPELRQAAGIEAKTRSILFSKEKFCADWQKVLSK